MPNQLDRIREFVQRELVELTGRAVPTLCESVLIRAGFYCGYRFRSESYCAVWFCEEDEIKIYDAAHTLVRVAAATSESRETRYAA